MPTQFRDFQDDVKGLLFADYNSAYSWSASTSLENDKCGFSASPSASNDGVNLDLSYSVNPKNKVSVNVNNSLNINPSFSHECGDHSFEVEPLEGDIRHTWKDATFASHISTNVWDGLASDGGASVLVKEGLELGVGYKFDPYRSGLRDYKLAARFSCGECLRKGSVIYAAYGGMDGKAFAFATPISNQATFVASTDKDDCFVVGAQYKSTCGAAATLHVKICERVAGLSVAKKIADTWNVAVSATFNLNKVGDVPGFGVSISS